MELVSHKPRVAGSNPASAIRLTQCHGILRRIKPLHLKGFFVGLWKCDDGLRCSRDGGIFVL